MRHRLLFFIAASALTLAVAVLYFRAAETPFFAKLEGQSLTWRFQLRGPIDPGPETLLRRALFSYKWYLIWIY